MKNTIHVLLIEPHPTAARIIGEMLERSENLGYELVRARSLEEAESIFKVCHFDLVMADLALPDSHGMGTLERLNVLAPELPVIAIAGPAEKNFSSQALSHGACHVLFRNQLNQPLILGAIDYAMEQKALRSASVWKREKSGFHDRLTGLPNRQLFEDRLVQALRLAKRQKQELAVVAIKIEGYSPETMDSMIKEAASRLSRCLRDSDTVGRLEGAQFGLILPKTGSARDLAALCVKMQDELRRPMASEAQGLAMDASLGVASYPSDADEADALAVRALGALDKAEQAGGGCVKFFDERLDGLVAERKHFETDLRLGIGQGQFKLVFQPIQRMGDGAVTMLEALVRWRHPKKGWIAPMDFIPQAEESGLIEPLGAWIFEEACRELNRLTAAGFHDIKITVNISPRQFYGRGLAQTVRRIVAETRVNPSRLCLEITESGAMRDIGYAAEVLGSLRETGMQVAIDDFGTGYSSLSVLSRFPVDILKLDKSFINDMLLREEDKAIVSLVIAMAHKLKLQVVAEGVEEESQRQMLLEMGCDLAQGFLFAPPLPMPEVIKALYDGPVMALASDSQGALRALLSVAA